MANPPQGKVFTFKVAELGYQVHSLNNTEKHVSFLTDPFYTRSDDNHKLVLYSPDRNKENRFARLWLEDTLTVLYSKPNVIGLQIHLPKRQTVSAAICYLLVQGLARKSGLLLHASFLISKGKAFLFLGPSGAGKSTIAKNAKGMFCVHDDRVAVRKINGRWWAFGVPLIDNDGRTGRNRCAPLARLFLIEKGDKLDVVSDSFPQLMESVASQTVAPDMMFSLRKNICESLFELVNGNDCQRLVFKKDSDVGTIV